MTLYIVFLHPENATVDPFTMVLHHLRVYD